MTDIKGEWLVDLAPHYYDLQNFPAGEVRALLNAFSQMLSHDACCGELASSLVTKQPCAEIPERLHAAAALVAAVRLLSAALLDVPVCLCRLAALWSVCLQSGIRRGDESYRAFNVM